MKQRKVDIAIIGAGTSGLNARREAEKAGKSVVLIEGGPYGTTCARVGCMPSKLLIAAADSAHGVAHAERFGVQVEQWRVDGPAVMERVRSERDRFAGFVVKSTEALPEDVRIRGWARFIGPQSLIVDDLQIDAESIVIATGSSPWIPPQLEPVRDLVAVNGDVFDWKDLPESVAMFGSGVIGIELGQALKRLGVDVHVFSPFVDLGGIQNPEILQTAIDIIGEDLPLHLGSDVTAVSERDGAIHVQWVEADGTRAEYTFQKVVAAAGRRANLENLNLDAAGIELAPNGLPSHWDPNTTQIGDSPIFVAGDASGHRPLLHEASDEGRIAGANAATFPRVRRGHRRVPLAIVFTDPNIAAVGRRWNSFEPGEAVVGRISFANQGRARVMGVNAGLLHLYADRNCQLVGAEMIAPRAENLSHLLAWSIDSNPDVSTLLSRPFYHPVLEEGVRTALRDLAKQLDRAGRCAPEEHAFAPGE